MDVRCKQTKGYFILEEKRATCILNSLFFIGNCEDDSRAITCPSVFFVVQLLFHGIASLGFVSSKVD